MIMISQTAVATLIARSFRGGEPLFSGDLTSFLGFGFLLSFDLDNKSTGFASLPPGDFQHPCKIAQ